MIPTKKYKTCGSQHMTIVLHYTDVSEKQTKTNQRNQKQKRKKRKDTGNSIVVLSWESATPCDRNVIIRVHV